MGEENVFSSFSSLTSYDISVTPNETLVKELNSKTTKNDRA